MAKSPEKVFNSFDFNSLHEKSLVSLIKRDDLQMKEVELWERVLKWGLEKNSTLLSDPMTCSSIQKTLKTSTL
ncbi:BTB/POZ protein [Rhizophagus irregularis DAOM 181602=DAOM 197198]|nr:BTB/POZ protein [Rhizophagus irregularis DAOM 181602=DAOM 197198]